MAIRFNELRQSSADTPPRLLIYGPEGIGKNTLALEFPSPFTFDFERGVPPGWPVANDEDVPNFATLMEAIGDLCTEDHEFKTVIFDSLDRIEAMIFDDLCQQENWVSIEQPGYGKGYKMALEKWREFIGAVRYLNRTRNVCTIFIAHSEASRFDDPTTSSYSRYDLRLNDKAGGIVKDDCDAIFFLNMRVSIKEQEAGMNKKVAKASGEARFIYTEARPAYAAKNRYGIPESFMYQKGKGFDVLSGYLPAMDTPPTRIDVDGVGEELAEEQVAAE
jgi:hypothetical protein